MANSQLYAYNGSGLDIQHHEVDQIVDQFKVSELSPDQVYWLNFHTTEPREHFERLFDRLGFHRLTLEDIYTEKQRPKLEEFQNYLFFSIQSALPREGHSRLEVEQISFVLGANFLISFQQRSSDHFTEVRNRIQQSIGKIRERGVDFLMFRLLDAIIDNYFEVLDEITEVNRNLEIRVLRDTSSSLLTRIELQKQKLIELRKIVLPMRDIAVQLEKTNNDFVNDITQPYFSDLKDNCLAILDEVDGHRQILEGLSNVYFAAQGQKMNEIMKVLTIVSTVFIPLTFIVGVYGMNFKYMPELSMPYGYLGVWILMALCALALLLFFFKKGWLKK